MDILKYQVLNYCLWIMKMLKSYLLKAKKLVILLFPSVMTDSDWLVPLREFVKTTWLGQTQIQCVLTTTCVQDHLQSLITRIIIPPTPWSLLTLLFSTGVMKVSFNDNVWNYNLWFLGYVMSGFAEARCVSYNDSAVWSGPHLVCKRLKMNQRRNDLNIYSSAIQCSALEKEIAHGIVEIKCQTFGCRQVFSIKFQTIIWCHRVKLSCLPGYYLDGINERFCNASGRWTPSPPSSTQCKGRNHWEILV